MAASAPLIVGGTENLFEYTVRVDGTSYGVFDTFSGGDSTAPVNKHRPGGLGIETLYATQTVYGNVTVGRVLQTARDWEMIRALNPKAGKVRAAVVGQPLDPDGNAYGKATTYSGAFIRVTPGSADSNSSSNRMVEIEIAVNQVS